MLFLLNLTLLLVTVAHCFDKCNCYNIQKSMASTNLNIFIIWTQITLRHHCTQILENLSQMLAYPYLMPT